MALRVGIHSAGILSSREAGTPSLPAGSDANIQTMARNVVNLFSQLYHELTPLLLMSSSPLSSVKNVVMVVY